MGREWLIEAHTQNTPYLSTVTVQHETRQNRARCLLMRVKTRRLVRHISMMGKVRRWEGANQFV